MGVISMKALLEAGAHFGHQTSRWNPKMKPYIFGARNGIHIIDLQKTSRMFDQAFDFVRQVTARGEKVLFVGTKKQAQNVIVEEATRCNMFYVQNRWLGGTLTNFRTVRQSVERLKTLNKMASDGSFQRLTKKEVLQLQREARKLERNLPGIKEMTRLPGLLYVVDPRKERIAVREANKLNIPVVALADTNCDPEGIDLIIPANDDAIRAIKLFTARMADACLEGAREYQEQITAQPRQAEKKPAKKSEARPGGPKVEVVSRQQIEQAMQEQAAPAGETPGTEKQD
ncbi:MAG: 30S ribosomal protein S2 [Deltaproteobacteria bacterium]|nr:MAG: 30S ribosomal protein S2 [Deltaproteobacteria bacterium]